MVASMNQTAMNRTALGAAARNGLAALVLLALAAPAAAQSSGKVAGFVRDEVGVGQMGAAVSVLSARGRVLKRVFTDYKGAFEIVGLLPGTYSFEVTLARFLPAVKSDLIIRAGARTFLDVNLRGLFSSLQLMVPGGGEIRDMTEDWKWVLRASHSTRPVLRFLPEEMDRERETRSVLRKLRGAVSDTHAYAQVSAGAGVRPTALANETDLGTSFAVATSLFGNNNLTVAGNIGSGGASQYTPTTAFRTSYRREIGPVNPEISLTVRQLQSSVAAGQALFGPRNRQAPTLDTFTLGFGDSVQLTESMRVEYGFLYETVRFLDRLNFISPYGRIIQKLGPDREIRLRFASGAPRPDRAVTGGERLRRDVSTLGMFPRIALQDGRTTVQRTEHIEIAYRERIGKGMIEAAIYQDRITDAAISALVPAGSFTNGNVLPDLFSRTSTINGGAHQIRGYRVSYARKLRDRLEAALGYGATGVLAPGADRLETSDANELRNALEVRRAHLVMASLSAEIPGSGTRVVSSYQWVSRSSAFAADLYNDFAANSQPGLNLIIRQPLPLSGPLPGKLEASADFRNLLKAGYIPMRTHDGQSMYLLQAVRSYRGALSFIF